MNSIHQQAEQLREQDNHQAALKLYEDAIALYQQSKDHLNLCEALCGRALAYKHLFWLTDDSVYAIIAKHSVEAALEIAKGLSEPGLLSRCYFRLAEMEMLVKHYSQAVALYSKALELYPRDEAEKGDLLYHLGEAQYHAGDKTSARQNFIKGLAMIEKYKDTTDSFVYHVWLSGGNARFAECFWNDDRILATQALNRAEQIINTDDRLIIRKRQLAALKQKLRSS